MFSTSLRIILFVYSVCFEVLLNIILYVMILALSDSVF